MIDWKEFLTELEKLVAGPRGGSTPESSPSRDRQPALSPGQVMICFVNRYLEAMDGIQYRIRLNGRYLEGRTTEKQYCVTLAPANLNPIEVHVWSRKANTYKRLDDVIPVLGEKKLVRKALKTYKASGKTGKHPADAPIKPPPKEPAPPPAPGPSPTDKQGTKAIPGSDESDLSRTKLERPIPDKITKEQLKKIFVKAKEDYLQRIADELNRDLAKFKLDTPVRRAHFFGQVRQEAGSGADKTEESFNYSPAGLIATFGYYKRHPKEAEEDGRQEQVLPGHKKKVTRAARQEVIANKVYGIGKMADSLGNRDAGDGWAYRGRGLKQITGRRNYTGFTFDHPIYWNEKIDFIAKPDLVAQFPYSVRSAVAFWLDNECWRLADRGVNDAAIDSVTEIINSGEIRNHDTGKYDARHDPVLNRRTYVHLAYAAFT